MDPSEQFWRRTHISIYGLVCCVAGMGAERSQPPWWVMMLVGMAIWWGAVLVSRERA